VTKGSAQIRVPVAPANIRNGYVCVRDFLWFFPKSAIRSASDGESAATLCTLDIAGLGTIETDIDATKGIFRWRGWKKFFRQHQVRPGDAVVFSRQAADRFTVTVAHSVLDGLASEGNAAERSQAPRARARVRRCNDLSGDEWLRYSVSVWSDIKKTGEEAALKHPAMFPTALCERLILMYLPRRGRHRILDPFMGSGATLVAAANLGKIGIGLDINEEYVALARRRLESPSLFRKASPSYAIYQADARRLLEFVEPSTIDLCVTSPPYWDILSQKRTADYKEIRNYGNLAEDLATIGDYGMFLNELAAVFKLVLQALRPGAYCIVVVMDLRKKDVFYPFHCDLAGRLAQVGFVFDDLIVWDRGREYNNLRPLGYPSVFRINKVHEVILIFRKPQER